jgi:hypothetical protein
MTNASPQSFVGQVLEFVQECFFLFLQVLTRPVHFGRDGTPSTKVAGLFVLGIAWVAAVAIRIVMSSVPAIVSWNRDNSNVIIWSRQEWSDLQAGDKAMASIAWMTASMAVMIIISALVMTLVLLFVRFRWFGNIEFGAVFRQSSVLISTAVVVVLISEAIVFGVAQSRAPIWFVGLLYVIVVLALPAYLVLCIPYLVWKTALNLNRLRTASAVVVSCILIFKVVDVIPTDFFVPDTRQDSLLSAQLDTLIGLAKKERYREAIELAQRAAPSYKDSIQLDSLTLSFTLRAFEHATAAPNKLPSASQQDSEWSSNTQARYKDLVETTDQLQDRYSDIPGMLLKVARAQLESGQCEKAHTVFEAVYEHRHAILMERLFAGLYLRTMRQEPNDFEPILARFSPLDDATFVRSLLASPGITIGMFRKKDGFATFAKGVEQLQKYGEELYQQSSPPRCDFVRSEAGAPGPPGQMYSPFFLVDSQPNQRLQWASRGSRPTIRLPIT